MKIYKKKCIFESRNQYELLVSLLLAISFYRKDEISSLIYSTEYIDSKIQAEINSLPGVNVHCLGRPNKMSRVLMFIKLFFVCLLNIFKADRVFVFHEVSPAIFFKLFKLRISLIEHGDINYRNIADLEFYKGSLYAFIKVRLMKQLYVGESSVFDEIYLKELHEAPLALKNKARHLDLLYLGGSLTMDERSIVNSIFLFDSDAYNSADFIDSVLLITQPFSELGIVSEEVKLTAYKIALENIKTPVVIKPHPKETTDYGLHFPDALILNSVTPLEVFYVNKVEFDKAITLNSSAIRSVYCKKRIILGTDIYG